MANQPTKYRKFVVGAASAALVASAVAPVAMAATFTDVKDNNSHKEAIDALSNAGVISGYEDGTFKPNKTLTRSDVVKLMGKWLVSEGYKVPTDYKTKPRFSDLKTTSNDELLKMSALVYDNGVFVGKPDGSLDANGDITRENMAIVLVRAFDRVHDIDLTSYVKDQDFKKDVTDLGKAKAEARPAIDVLDFFDITNPAAPEFNPKSTTTRGQFASFLYKTTQADFSEVGGGIVAPGVASVKAVNATTVEVEMKDKVENINSLNFKIDGLTVSNAAVKQTNDKVIVLTTATQKGGEKYTVTLNEKAIGSFTGISAVVPEKISLNTKSVQGVVGQQVILSANIGVKEAGVPVTFNVKANTTGTLNKDQVFEVVTNADGIATFSYTQYNAGNDTVTVYPTGKADLREQGTVYWENAAQLTIKDITEATTLANGSKKAYEINSEKNANKYVFVTFKENLNVTPDKLVKTIKAEGVTTYNLDTVTGVPTTTSADYPYKASTGGEAVIAVKLDGKGKANLVLTGSNATATPIVYEGKQLSNTNGTSQLNFDAKYDARAMQASATPVTFNVQHALGLTIKAEGVQNAATYKNATETGGRDYTVTFNTKDGKAAAPGTVVNVAIDTENIKGSLRLLDSDNKAVTPTQDGKINIYKVLVEKDGQAKFTVASTVENDYVAPVAFIDNGKTNGKLDADDLQSNGEVTYFVDAVNYTANLKAVDKNGKKVTTVVANGAEPATFIYQLVDQNGKPRSSTDATTVSFEVQAGTGNLSANGTLVAAGTTKTVPAVIGAGQTEAKVQVTASAPTNATVSATGSKAGVVLPSTNPSSVSVNFSQYGSAAITGTVTNLNTTLEVLTINDTVYTYANAKAYQIKGSAVTKSAFENEIVTGTSKVSVTVDADGKFTFNVLDANTGNPGTGTSTAVVDQLKNATTDAAKTAVLKAAYPELSDTQVAALLTPVKTKVNDGTINASNLQADYDSLFVSVKSAVALDTTGDGKADAVELTFSENLANPTNLLPADFAVTNGTVSAVVDGTASDNKVRLTITGATSTNVGTLTVKSTTTNPVAGKTLVSGSMAVEAATIETGVAGNGVVSQAGDAGTKQIQTLTATAATATGDAIVSIVAKGFNGDAPLNINVPVIASDDAGTVATKTFNALKANTTVTNFFDVTLSTDDVILTAKTAAADDTTMKVTLANNVTLATAANTAGVAPKQETVNITITSGATNAAGTASIKLVDGTFNKTISASVAKTDSTTTVAGKLFAALIADTDVTAHYTASLNGAVITLVDNTPGVGTVTTVTVK
ncbi:S-layer homology domain-containing protein [Sporosarcina sp. P1]|uniref:S-layer homology domain-containing protein n=1 Tax=Sporosarcina sp. P1 TaxID=2048257 RepID=UPI000C16A383|nr:S-layer homology domain-containing protein [Sporosarcina sp. P1]PIC83062.1 hypothetical protein CSV73_08725 [Sporosarcina sp. P1]